MSLSRVSLFISPKSPIEPISSPSPSSSYSISQEEDPPTELEFEEEEESEEVSDSSPPFLLLDSWFGPPRCKGDWKDKRSDKSIASFELITGGEGPEIEIERSIDRGFEFVVAEEEEGIG